MASARTCPHGPERRLLISGTRVREMLASGETIDEHFSRPEVLDVLREYYAGLDGKVETGLHSN
jgi:sulfate adenylyltransferase